MVKNRVAVVTGASKGIGRAIAEKLAREGYRVVIGFDTDIEGARKTRGIIGKGNAIIVRADVSKTDDCKKLIDAALEKFGCVDILVNNAGITLSKQIWKTSEKDWERCMGTNLKGPFFLSKYASDHMENGCIVNVSSIRAFKSRKMLAAYAASKAGLLGMTKSMAIDLADRGIRVNAVIPGVIESERVKNYPEPMLKRFREATLLKRLGRPEEIANVVAFLASGDASYIDGAAILVDGGESCQ